MGQAKVLYVRKLTDDVGEDLLRETFGHFGEVVKKVKFFAFIHYNKRSSALAAIDAMHEEQLGGANINVSLVKPQL